MPQFFFHIRYFILLMLRSAWHIKFYYLMKMALNKSNYWEISVMNAVIFSSFLLIK